MKVSVDREKCVGAGQYALTAPEAFDQADENGLVVLLLEQPDSDQHASARAVAHDCFAGAIEVDAG